MKNIKNVVIAFLAGLFSNLSSVLPGWLFVAIRRRDERDDNKPTDRRPS